MKRFKIGLVVLTMIVTLVSGYMPVSAANDNIAFGKTVTASTTYLNRDWTPDKAVDGIVDDTTAKNSRWASMRVGSVYPGTSPSDYDSSIEQWLLIDLEANTPVSQVNIFWEGASATRYKLQGSLDGENFTDILSDGASSAGWKKHNSFGTISMRYLRVLCQEPKVARYGYSLFEVEIYQQKVLESSADVIASIESIAPVLSGDGKSVILPDVPSGYMASIFGTDNEQVVTKAGKVIQPLVDMKVNFMYKVTNISGDDTAVSSKDVLMSIPGKYKQLDTDNVKPNVVPGLREWKGAQGAFAMKASSKIVLDSESLRNAGKVIQGYFKEMLARDIDIVVGIPQQGDVFLKHGSTKEEVGNEGYYLVIDDFVTIEAPTYTGLVYGGTSITQILYQDQGRDHAPRGIARDYPQYEVRAGMVDVGRMYIPLEYLEELTIYMSWFKLNEMQVHINDYWGPSGYSAYRLESTTYPSIVAKDGYYTKSAYKQYQKNMKAYSIDVITEIDTPYHAEAFKDISGVQMLAGKPGYLDITTDDAYEANKKIVENLFDEYLDGDDPVIQSDKFHIGTDEYDKKYGEQMRKWTDHFINYVNDKGYQTRAWASLGKNGFNGSTPVSNQATMNLWAPYWADVKETYEAGYDVINTYGGWLYIVPAGNAGYPDRLDTKRVYEEFEVNNFKSGRNPKGEAIMPVAHPQTKGAEYALWNDMTSFETGFSWFDIHDRLKDAVSVVAEKTWFGEDEDGQTYAQFKERIDALQDKVPNANPGRYIESKTTQIAEYDFTKSSNLLEDMSGNQYDARLVNTENRNGSLHFDGQGYVSLPMESVGYPYTVSMDVKLSEINAKTTLFNGKDGTLYASYDGKVGYQRGSYAFTFDYTLVEGKQYNIVFVANDKVLTLYVDGKKISDGKLTTSTIAGKAQESSTFVLPVERIMDQAKGELSALSIYNFAFSAKEVQDLFGYKARQNYALNVPVSVSGLEVYDGRFTAEMAVDGVVSSTSRVSFAKNADEQWLLMDLGTQIAVSEVVLNFESVVGKYEIQVSQDGETFTTVYTKDEGTVFGASSAIEVAQFDTVKARYVKYVQKERWTHSSGNKYSGSLYEIEIYQSLRDELLESIHLVEKELEKYVVGNRNGQLDQEYYQAMQSKLQDYKRIAELDTLTQNQMESAKTVLAKDMSMIENHILFIEQEAKDAYQALKELDYHNYTVDSYQLMIGKQAVIETRLESMENYQDVQSVLELIDEAKGLLVSVNNQALKVLIQTVEQLDLEEYNDVAELMKALQMAKDVYEAPVSQAAIDKAHYDLQKIYQLLEKEIVVTNPDKSVTVSGKLPQDIQLSVQQLSHAEVAEMLMIIKEKNLDFFKTATLEKVFEIDLLLDGEQYVFDNSVMVSLKVDDDIKEKNLGIVAISKDGYITPFMSVYDGESISFETTHFSTYAIVSYEKTSEIVNPKPVTGDNTPMVLYVSLLLGGIYVALKTYKRKEDKC